MRRKPAFILMLVLGLMCLIDGPIKKDPKETLIGLAVTIYAAVTLVSDHRKKKAATQAQKPR